MGPIHKFGFSPKQIVTNIFLVCFLSFHNFKFTSALIPTIKWTSDHNIAYYNRSCHPTTGHSPTICICQPGYVYVEETQLCWEVPTMPHHPCAHDLQCHGGKWGEYSRCDKVTARCECYADPLKHGRRLAYWALEGGGKCLLRSPVDLCRNDLDCVKVTGEGSYCRLLEEFYYDGSRKESLHGSCQCREGTHIWYPPLKSCLPFARGEGDICLVTPQCTEGSMGRLSRCEVGGKYLEWSQGRCECWPRGRTVFYLRSGQCFEIKEINDQCINGDECRASLGEATECDESSRICRRKKAGDLCNSDEDCNVDRWKKELMCTFNDLPLMVPTVEKYLYYGKCEASGLEGSNGGKIFAWRSSVFVVIAIICVIL